MYSHRVAIIEVNATIRELLSSETQLTHSVLGANGRLKINIVAVDGCYDVTVDMFDLDGNTVKWWTVTSLPSVDDVLHYTNHIMYNAVLEENFAFFTSQNIIIFNINDGLVWNGESFGDLENARVFTTWGKAAKKMNELSLSGLSFCSVDEYKEMAHIIANY